MPKFKVVKDGPKDIKSKIAAIRERLGLRGIIIAVIVLIAILLGIFLFLNRRFSDYEVIESQTSGANASVRFTSFSKGILRSSNDGVSYLKDNFETQWTQGFNMQKALIDISGDYAVAVDSGGTDIYLFNKDGFVKKIEVNYGVEQIRVSAKGNVFAITASKDKRYMKYYNSNGDLIAEGMVQLKKTGYPVNFDISDDGRLLMMSYLYVSNGISKTNVSFYNFDEAGKTEIDRIVASYEYDNAIIPEVKFFGNDTAVAIGDSSAYIFTGASKPALQKTIEFDKEVQSVFYDNDKIGIVFANPGEENPYKVQVYKPGGSKTVDIGIDIDYSDICFAGENILAYNGNQCKLYSELGFCRFDYSFDNRIYQIAPVSGGARYVLVTGDEAKVIKLK